MVKFQNKEIFLGLLLIIFITDIVILLNLPLFRQFFGFLLISLLPGIIILRALKINKLGKTNTFVFAVGLSLIFTMGLGLLINEILPFFGNEAPLSTISLLISFNLIEITLLLVAYTQNSYEEIIIIPLFDKIDKLCLIIAFSILFLSMIGVSVLNKFGNNIILISLFFVIVFLIGLVALKNNKLSLSLYPLLILIISISLILIFPLRSTHILGYDTNLEYYFFQNTLGQLHWTILESGLLDSCLSISLLPSVYVSLLGLNSELVFRIYSSLLFSISPIVVYLIAKKYVYPYYAFLASIFFMSQWTFTNTESLARSNIAILFVSLIILSLFSENFNNFNKRFLVIAFLFGCILSHYSSSYILFIILLSTFIITHLLTMKYKISKNLTFFMIVIFFCALFIWFSIVIGGPFRDAVQFIETIFDFGNARYAPELASLTGQNLPYRWLSPISLFIKWVTFCFIGYGVFVGLAFWLKNTRKVQTNQIEPDLINLDIEFIIIGFISGLILLLTIILPFISVGYDIDRIYLLISIILSSFFIIGGIIFIKQLNLFLKFFIRKENSILLKVLTPTCVITCVVIIHFLFTMSIPHQFAGDDTTFMFHTNDKAYSVILIHDQDPFGAIWMKQFREKNLKIYSDAYSEKILQSQSEIRSTQKIPNINSEPLFEKGYLFTIYDANVNHRIINNVRAPTNLGPRYNEIVKDLSKVYTNNGSVIWTI